MDIFCPFSFSSIFTNPMFLLPMVILVLILLIGILGFLLARRRMLKRQEGESCKEASASISISSVIHRCPCPVPRALDNQTHANIIAAVSQGSKTEGPAPTPLDSEQGHGSGCPDQHSSQTHFHLSRGLAASED